MRTGLNSFSKEKKGAITNDRTGGHIHIGAQGLGNKIEAWQNLFFS